jgi:uncharacterized protein YbjT (DUF2867 family)
MRDTTAVLLGGSGLVGGFCLRTLISDPRYQRITALSRRKLELPPDSRLVERLVNFEQITAGDFAGAEDIFCALGTTSRKAGSQAAFRTVDLQYPLNAAKAALQAGARQFVLVSSVGANATAKNFYLRTKGEVELAISSLGFSSVHILRPSLLLGRREEFRLGERIAIAVAPLVNFAMLGSMRRYRAISAGAVGRAMVAAARSGKAGTLVYEHDEIEALASR